MPYCRNCGSELVNGVCPNGHTSTVSSSENLLQPTQIVQSPFEQNAAPPTQPMLQQQPIFSAPAAPVAQAPQDKKKSKAPIIIIICLLVLFFIVLAVGAVGVGLYFFIKEDKPQVPQTPYVAASIAPSSEEVAPPTVSEPAPDAPAEEPPAADAETLIAMLQQSEYAMWNVTALPADQEIKETLIRSSNWYTTCGVLTMTLWAEGVHAESTVSLDMHPVSQQSIQNTVSSFYGIENYYVENDAFGTEATGYRIPAHGPMHSAELLLDTLTAEGNTFSIQTLITTFDSYGEDAQTNTITLLHTFEANPAGSYMPFRVVTVQEVATTYPLYPDNIVPPSDLYDATIVVEVNVDELNIRQGPGTDYESFGLLEEGYELYVVGYTNNGEWLCTTAGWVSGEYVTVVGTL